MSRTILLSILLMIVFCGSAKAQTDPTAMTSVGQANGNWVLAIHGGAGGPPKGSMKPETEKQYMDSLNKALGIGAAVLSSGGTSLDAVEQVIRFMEDCPLFNAGKGAVLTSEGKAELDASIMDGRSGEAGAVASVTTIKNPITASRAVMEKSPHVLFVSKGAEEFAREKGLVMVDNSYFVTAEKKEAWKAAKEKKKNEKPSPSSAGKETKGTVGCVALDVNGNLAAGTSTGGMMMKMSGRVGDSPIIGAGTWADQLCAVSCTGWGEYFIRNVAAYSVSAAMQFSGRNLEDACNLVIFETIKAKGGDGGLIAVDREGNVAMPFSSNAMFRGKVSKGSQPVVMIW
jgi:beta-aspartyl-peptidase (threonine type)